LHVDRPGEHGLEALGLLTGYTHKSTRRWKAATT
jgi:hypothetical protein